LSDRYRNIARVKAIEKKNEQKLLAVNPTLDDESGIYFLTRVDEETGIKYSYVGQALHIKQRMLQHMVIAEPCIHGKETTMERRRHRPSP
jgi:hypothetical protein